MRSKATREARLAVGSSAQYKRSLNELPMCVSTNSNRESFPAASLSERGQARLESPSPAPRSNPSMSPPRSLGARGPGAHTVLDFLDRDSDPAGAYQT